MLVALAALSACQTPPRAPPPAPAPAPEPPTPPPAQGRVLGRTEQLLVYVPRPGESLGEVAERWLGSRDRAWQIAEVNGGRWQPRAGEPLVVPLVWPHPLGVTSEGAQEIPILCYHRLGPEASKMRVTPEAFAAQMDWLAEHHYRVVRLSDLRAFMAGREPLPQRSVVLTFDDGYEAVFRYAYDVLRTHRFPATLFVYTDFIGSSDALTWKQMQEMVASGLVDVQGHSKTHRNLIEREPGEDDTDYRRNLDLELREPRRLIERELGAEGVHVDAFAYPYGDADGAVLDAMRRNHYALGLTVNAGGNPFYAAPLLLRRIMIFGDDDLQAFEARLLMQRGAHHP